MDRPRAPNLVSKLMETMRESQSSINTDMMRSQTILPEISGRQIEVKKPAVQTKVGRVLIKRISNQKNRNSLLFRNAKRESRKPLVKNADVREIDQ